MAGATARALAHSRQYRLGGRRTAPMVRLPAAATLAGRQLGEHLERPQPLLASGGEVRTDCQEPLGSVASAPAAGDPPLELDHPQVPLGEVVIERNPEVVREPHLGLALVEAKQQVLRLAPLRPRTVAVGEAA